MKLYEITETSPISNYQDKQYRFRSLFNSCVGTWNYTKESAIIEGEIHTEIICTIYPDLRKLLTVTELKGK